MPARPAVLFRQLAAPPTDGECLRRYVLTRDEAAFAELVRRNGPLVLRACRSVLRDPAAADDAFQATFLALARHAGRLTESASVAGWLYRVAVRSAGAVRRADVRRRRREQAAAPAPDQHDDRSWAEVRGAIDAEIARLPEQYRTPVLLCYVQGLTYDEAARRLGCPPGALRGRLERGRAILRRRLQRLGLPAVALLGAGVPAVSAELRAATLAAVRAAPAAGGRLLAGTLAGCLLVAAGVGLVAVGQPPAEKPRPDDPPAVVAPEPPRPGVDALGDPLPPGAIARLGSARFRHGANLDRVVVSANGKRIASRAENTWRLWDGDTGRPLSYCKELAGLKTADPGVPGGHAWFTLTAAGDAVVAIVTEKDRFRVLDPETGAEALNLPRRDQLQALGITPDGKTVFAMKHDFFAPGGARTFLRAWRAGTDRWVDVGDFPGGGGEARARFSADSTIVAVGLPTGGVGVWDLREGRSLLQLPPTGQPFFEAVALSADGTLLAKEDRTANAVRVYEVATGKERPRLPDQPKQFGQALAFSPDGRTLAAVEQPINIRLWDLTTNKKVRDVQAHDFQVRDLAFAAGGKRLVAADGDGVTVFDPATGKALVDYGGHTYTIWAAAWSPDGKRLATGAAYTDNVGRVWDPATGKKAFELRGHRYGIEELAYSPDGQLIATGSQDRLVKLWDADSGRELHSFDAKDGMVYAMAFRPDGRFLVSGGSKALHVWDVAGRKEARTLPYAGGLALDIAFHPDGRRLLVRDRAAGLRVLDFDSGKELARFAWADENVNGTALSPDGRLLASGHADGSIKLWDFATGKELRALTDPAPPPAADTRVMGLTFAPDGRTVAATFGGGDVRVYEVATGLARHRFAGHISAALRVEFAPDGSRLASTGADHTILIWDLTGARLSSAPLPRDVESAWADLAADDAARGFAAIAYLLAHPDRAVRLLTEKLKPVAPADAKAVAALIGQLESPRFADREKASKELAALGERATGPLRAAAAGPTSAELRQRLAPLVAELGDPKATGDRLRSIRAVEALERLGTADAREVLTALAAGADGATVTREARAAVGRLASGGR